jgi:8-amino-7-oxononanoate synthase
MNRESWILGELDELRAQHLFRALSLFPAAGGKMEIGGKPCLNFASNDYLDLSGHPLVIDAARQALADYGAGSTASRLVAGTLDLHERLERKLAAHKGYPAALVFGSGYLANAGIIASLAGDGDAILADKLVHASVIDAAKLSGAKLIRFRHNDAGHLRELAKKSTGFRRSLIVTESVFSMDGDLAPLAEIAEIAREISAVLVVDEAHATGVFGPNGSGRVRELNLESAVNVSMFTMSKGLGGYGGGVACSPVLRDWFINRARSFIYTTSLPPSVIGAAIAAVDLLDEHPEWGTELLKRARNFRAALKSRGLDTLDSASQIVPVVVGDNEKTMAVAKRLRERNILVAAIRPPTVPAGTARLRLSLTLAHSDADLEHAAIAIAEAVR